MASASASAANKLVWWHGGSGELTEGKRYNVVSHGGYTVIQAKSAGTKVEIHCEAVEGKGWIENPSSKGNGQGYADTEFKECAVSGANFKGCIIPGYKFSLSAGTDLVEISGKIQDRYTPEGGGFVNLVLEECENTSLDEPYLLSGTYNTAINGATSEQEFVGEPAELSLFGNSAALEGSVKEELEGGGKIEVHSMLSHPQWYSGATKLKQGEKVNITAHPTHVVMEKVTLGGATVKIECEAEMSGSWLENPSGGGAGIGHTEIKYSGCAQTGLPGCKITGTKSYPASVEMVSTGEIELKSESSWFAGFILGGCTPTGLNGEYFLGGTDYGWIDSVPKSQFEFTAGLSASMTFAGNKMKWIGTFEVEKEGGGTILGGE
jgi:hypothetical protein